LIFRDFRSPWPHLDRRGSRHYVAPPQAEPEAPVSRSLSPIVLIPSRLASTRLQGKPLADIHGKPMIEHVWRRALLSGIGPVVVAAADSEIAAVIQKAGGTVVLTDPRHPSGSDRIWEALRHVDPGASHDIVVNLQGDLPTIDPLIIRRVLDPLAEDDVDIATLAAEIRRDAERDDPNVVKVAAAFDAASGKSIARALYFSRAAIPANPGPLYHHIGIYAYRRGALERFVSLRPGILERRERLEQLRALEAGMRIDVALVDTVPLGVDTPAELARARELAAATGEVD
jgi:3-deoxy-manno-octulosonate cytidylyltransferase (CMP-KDO synthetase)